MNLAVYSLALYSLGLIANYWLGSQALIALKFAIKQIVDYLIRGALYLVNFVFEDAAKNSSATGVRRERT